MGNPASFVSAASVDDVNTFTAAQTIATTAGSAGVRTALTVTGAADTGCTASTEQSDVYLNLARTVTWATGALTTQRAIRIASPTYAFAGASTITSAATLYVSNAPQAGTNATITNAYALWVDDGRVRFDGVVAMNAVPVVYADSQTGGSPTVSRPAGIVRVASGATTVTVTNTMVASTSYIFAQIRNTTTNAVYIAHVVPGSGSFVITLSGDPGASHADISFLVVNPGTGV